MQERKMSERAGDRDRRSGGDRVREYTACGPLKTDEIAEKCKSRTVYFCLL